MTNQDLSEQRRRANRAWELLQRLERAGLKVLTRRGKVILDPPSRLPRTWLAEVKEYLPELVAWLEDPVAFAICLDDPPDWTDGPVRLETYTILRLPDCPPVAMSSCQLSVKTGAGLGLARLG